MTEAEWLASVDPAAMLAFARTLGRKDCDCDCGCRVSDRKLRLFALACCRLWPAPGSPSPLDELEALVERGAGEPDYLALDPLARGGGARWAAHQFSRVRASAAGMAALLREVLGNPFRPVPLPWLQDPPVNRELAPPYCPWLTPTVLALATAAYEERGDDGTLDPVRLAVLADALEEAGCGGETCRHCYGSGTYTVRAANPGLSAANGYGAATTYSEWRGCRHCGGDHDRKGSGVAPHALLQHLRAPGPHVRGCWAVDLVRGR